MVAQDDDVQWALEVKELKMLAQKAHHVLLLQSCILCSDH